jgi:hypothetical protein
MEGLEAFAALLKIGMVEDDKHMHYRISSTGVRYKTILPVASESRDESKASYIGTVNDIRRFRP